MNLWTWANIAFSFMIIEKTATFTTLLSFMEQVFLSSTVTEYSSLTIELNKPIKNDLVLDKTQEYLYVMTTDKVMYPSLFKHQVQFNFLCVFTWDLNISLSFLEPTLVTGAAPALHLCVHLHRQKDSRILQINESAAGIMGWMKTVWIMYLLLPASAPLCFLLPQAEVMGLITWLSLGERLHPYYSEWDQEVSSPLKLCNGVWAKDEAVMFGTRTPQGQAATHRGEHLSCLPMPPI